MSKEQWPIEGICTVCEVEPCCCEPDHTGDEPVEDYRDGNFRDPGIPEPGE